MYSLAVIVLLVLPASHAHSTGYSVNLPVANRNEISGQYSSDGWMISFHALLKGKIIEAVTTFKNTTAELEKENEVKHKFSIELCFQDFGVRVIPDTEKHLIVAAHELVKTTGRKFPNNVIELYEEMADELYKCTTARTWYTSNMLQHNVSRQCCQHSSTHLLRESKHLHPFSPVSMVSEREW